VSYAMGFSTEINEKVEFGTTRAFFKSGGCVFVSSPMCSTVAFLYFGLENGSNPQWQKVRY